jgi:ParB-like chromosome segregation protein Spo0J
MPIGSYTPKQRMEAIAEAETRLDREGHKPLIWLRPNQIKTKPELFQPRTITYGLRSTEDSHVQALITAIRAGDTIKPPPLVIKLRDEGYVVVDGHHTLAAYKGADKGDKKIKCEWFPGTVREAFDVSMARNSEDKQPVANADKQERAWTLVVMPPHPKTTKQVGEIRYNTKVSERQVWTMKKVWETAQARDKAGEAFRHRLQLRHDASVGNPYLPDLEGEIEGAVECLAGLTWTMAWACYQGLSLEQASDHEQAASLARLLDAKMQDKLKRSADHSDSAQPSRSGAHGQTGGGVGKTTGRAESPKRGPR